MFFLFLRSRIERYKGYRSYLSKSRGKNSRYRRTEVLKVKRRNLEVVSYGTDDMLICSVSGARRC